MKAKEFDALIKSKFKENDFEYNPDNWGKMQWKLENGKKNDNKRLLMIVVVGIAASFTLLAVGTAFYKYFNIPAQESAISRKNEINRTTEYANTTQSLNELSASNDQYIKTHAPGNNAEPIKHSARPVTAAIHVPAIIKAAKEQLAGNEPKHIQTTPLADLNEKTIISPKAQLAGSKLPADQQYETVNTNNKKINLSFGGGYSYGSVGSGYMLNATACKQINSRLYLEGGVAIVNNTTSNTTTTTYTPPGSNPPITWGSAQSTKPNKTEPVNIVNTSNLNLYYMQLTPVVGYRLHNKIRIGMGADVQKLLQNKYTHVRTESGELFAIPEIDLGVVGKAEYALTNRIKTSISYREGISNAINSNKHLLDRDYLQVQLNYTFSK